MATTETLTGRVVSANDKGIKLEGHDDWFNYSKHRDVTRASKGDTVTITAAGVWINELLITGGGSSNGTSNQQQYDNRQQSIERLACLKAAADFLGQLSQTHEDVTSAHVTMLAEKFVRWVQQEPDGE